jgi:hypothetical protein
MIPARIHFARMAMIAGYRADVSASFPNQGGIAADRQSKTVARMSASDIRVGPVGLWPPGCR